MDELEEAYEVAPWLIKPESSNFYKRWVFFTALVLQIELICIPLILVEKKLLEKCNYLFWTLDVIWVLNMLINFQKVRPEKPSKNPLEVAASYIKSEFAIDLVATLPPILTSHS